MYSMSEGMSYALHAQKRYLGSEVMFFSRDLSIAEELIPQA